MRIVQKLSKTLVERAVCECGGEYLPTGVVFFVFPPKYEHQCRQCGRIQNLDFVYPRVADENRAASGCTLDKETLQR